MGKYLKYREIGLTTHVARKSTRDNVHNTGKNAYTAYTDGGCRNLSVYGEGGSAYVILHGGEVVKTSSKGFLHTTNNRMEMLSIISAVCSVPDGAHLTVYSDSEYAINTLSGVWRARKNTDLMRLYELHSKRLCSISFRWVKGHNGDKYNEMVDAMCTDAIQAITDKYCLPKDRFRKRRSKPFQYSIGF